MSSKAFISYARPDEAFAVRLHDDLESAGFNVWLDRKDIKTGEIWEEKIAVALKESMVLIVILTPESVASPAVRDEVAYALGKKKRVVPVLLRDCEIPYRIARLHYTDFQADYDSSLKHLVATLSFPVDVPDGSELPASDSAVAGPALISQSLPESLASDVGEVIAASRRSTLGILAVVAALVILAACAAIAYKWNRAGVALLLSNSDQAAGLQGKGSAQSKAPSVPTPHVTPAPLPRQSPESTPAGALVKKSTRSPGAVSLYSSAKCGPYNVPENLPKCCSILGKCANDCVEAKRQAGINDNCI